MYKDERDIFYYDALSESWNRKYKGLQPFAHYELAKAIKWLWTNGKAEIVKSNLQATYVTQMRIFADRCELLIGFADTNAADPTLNDHGAKKRRVVTKVGNEGLEHSTHIVWHYGNKTNNVPCAFYIEGATGLSSTAVVKFLNSLIRLFTKSFPKHFTMFDPEGTVDASGVYKRISIRPILQLRGHPSEAFIKDLVAGELSELELITESNSAKIWDSQGYAIEDHRAVLIKPSPLKHVPKAKAFADAVLSKIVTKDYEKARVVFNTAGNIRKNVTFYSHNYQLVNDLKYVKKDRIVNLGGNLPNAFDALNPRIIAAMRMIAVIKKKKKKQKI